MTTRLTCAAKTDVGLKRTNNEDNLIMVPAQGLYVLADGMGGHASGEVASTMCVNHVAKFICETAKQPGFEFPYKPKSDLSYEGNLLSNAIQYASERIFIQSCKDRAMEGMGTTVTAIYNAPHGLVLAHVGDSRIYRIRKGHITQMSRDHSLLNHLIDKGELKPEDAKNFAQKNVILRALGLKDYVDVEVHEVPREQGDIYVMCSDGLSDLVSEDNICKTVTQASNLDDACDKLIGLALKAGGKDNVTVVCVCVEQEDGDAVMPRGVSAPAESKGLVSVPHLSTTTSSSPSNPRPSPTRKMVPPPAAGRSMPTPPGMERPKPAPEKPKRLHSIREIVREPVQVISSGEISGRRSFANMPAIPSRAKMKAVLPEKQDTEKDPIQNQASPIHHSAPKEDTPEPRPVETNEVAEPRLVRSENSSLESDSSASHPETALLFTEPPSAAEAPDKPESQESVSTAGMSAEFNTDFYRDDPDFLDDGTATVLECPVIDDELVARLQSRPEETAEESQQPATNPEVPTYSTSPSNPIPKLPLPKPNIPAVPRLPIPSLKPPVRHDINNMDKPRSLGSAQDFKPVRPASQNDFDDVAPKPYVPPKNVVVPPKDYEGDSIEIASDTIEIITQPRNPGRRGHR